VNCLAIELQLSKNKMQECANRKGATKTQAFFKFPRMYYALNWVSYYKKAGSTIDHHLAPKVSNAPCNSFTAVDTSSKFRAEIAHLACFWALRMASSSAT